MSQRAVEAVLGRMITDGEFRARFCAAPLDVCRENALVLTPRETAALLRVDLVLLHEVAVRLDPQIVRAAVLKCNSEEPTSPSMKSAARRPLLSRRSSGGSLR